MRTEGEDEKHSTRFITKRCFASVFNGPPAPARPEKSRKVSAEVVTPRLSLPLSLSVFTLFSPLVSCLPFAPAATRQHGSRIIFHFLSSFLVPSAARSPRGVAPRKGPPRKKTISSFYTIRRATVRSLRCISSSAFSRRCTSLSEAIASKQVRYLSHITRFFFLQNKSNIIVEATARSKAPCSSN